MSNPNKPPLKRYFVSRAFRQLRQRMRAFKAMQDNNVYIQYHEIIIGLTRAPFDIPAGGFKGMLPDSFAERAAQHVRQVLTRDQRASDIYPLVMCHVAGQRDTCVVTAPPTLRKVLGRDGMKVAPLRSAVKWWMRQLNYWFTGGRFLVRNMVSTVGVPAPNVPYAVFTDIRRKNLPPEEASAAYSADIHSWYRRSKLFDPEIKAYWAHGLLDPATVSLPGVQVVVDPLPQLKTAGKKASFLIAGTGITLNALCRSLMGQWWAAMILRDALLLAYVRRLEPDQFARDYFYNCTNSGIRPMWTYLAEKNGSRVTSIEYSQNVFYGHLPGRPDYRLKDPTCSLYNWSRIAVMNDAHANSLEIIAEAPGIAAYIPTGAVGWRDSGKLIDEIPKPSIAVFDSHPIRDATMARNGWAPRYHTDPNVVLAFLRSIFSIAEAKGLTIVYKPKIAIDSSEPLIDQNHYYPRAAHFRRLIEQYNCFLIDKDIAAARVAQACDMAVSVPFSSSGFISNLSGVPTAFFDVCGTLTGFESRAYDLPLLHSENEVADWIDQVLANTKIPSDLATPGTPMKTVLR